MQQKQNIDKVEKQSNLNRQAQGVDKDPKEEKSKGEQVQQSDLKGKKVDADLSKASDRPLK
jgi:hypothetical protein